MTESTNNQILTNAQTLSSPTHRVNCAHGILLGDPCFHCAQGGVYFDRDKEVYQNIINNTHNISFELAFALFERVNFWKKASTELSLDIYFKAVKKNSDINWSIQSLKQAYYLAREFPHLKDKKENRLKFSIYREIASAKLTPEQKKEIITKAEDENLKFSSVRRLKEEYQGKEKRLTQSKTITFKSRENLTQEINQFFSERTDIQEGTKITVTIKNKEEK